MSQSSTKTKMNQTILKKLAINISTDKRSIEAKELSRQFLVTAILCVVMILVMMGIRNWSIFDNVRAAGLTTWEIFYSSFGIIYAIIMGLIIVEVLKRWHELASIINTEINVIGDIHDCVKYYFGNNSEARKETNKALIVYIDKLSNYEWTQMTNFRRRVPLRRLSKTSLRRIFKIWQERSLQDYSLERFEDSGIDRIMCTIGQLEPQGITEQHAMGTIISKTCDLTTHRANRIEMAEHYLSLSFYLFGIFMSVILVIGALLLGIENVYIHGLIVFTITAAVTGLFQLLIDLDRPFDGHFKISKTPIKALKKKLIEE